MEENKPINRPDEAQPPNNPQDAVHEHPLNPPSTDESIVPTGDHAAKSSLPFQ